MRFTRFFAVALLFLLLPAGRVFAAQDLTPLSIKAMRHHADGVDQVFEFDVANSLDSSIQAHGRLVVINVYSADKPETVLIDGLTIPAGGTATLDVRWRNAPLVGQVRALLVLTDDQHPSSVGSYGFWLVPLAQAGVFAGLAAASIILALVVLRLPRYLKGRVPADMIAYVIEAEDTVMSLAGRFDVSWQDLTRANRLKPPYALTPGRRIFIPKHGLKRPGAPPDKTA